MSGYSVTFVLKNNTNNLLGAADGSSGSDSTNDSSSGDGGVHFIVATMMERC